MRITKVQLKDIVKECLIEILAEGMGSSTSASISETAKNKTRSAPIRSSTVLKQNASKIKIQSNALKEAIRLESGGNDIMASILADTAKKTLPMMLENERSKVTPSVGGTVERVVASHDPQELFGEETASKWADLAFMGLSKK
jgi:hypothetical protein